MANQPTSMNKKKQATQPTTRPTTIEEVEAQQQETRHTHSKDRLVSFILNTNKNKKKKKQEKAPMTMTHMLAIIKEEPKSLKKKKKQATPPKTRSPPNTRSPPKDPSRKHKHYRKESSQKR